MGKVLQEIGPSEADFIRQQKVFFVGTAPLDSNHHVNVSPKASSSAVVILGPHKVAYLDLTGSGSEASAHVLENQRMTLMFCNLEAGPPKILRLHGKAELVVKEEVPSNVLDKFPSSLTSNLGFRAIFILHVERVSSSCGYSLPIMKYEKTRSILDETTVKLGEERIREYGIEKNSFSIDGLPSIGLVRNKHLTIAPKLEDGFVKGQKIVHGSKGKDNNLPGTSQEQLNKLAIRPTYKQRTNRLMVYYGALLFVIGLLSGSLITRFGVMDTLTNHLLSGTDL